MEKIKTMLERLSRNSAWSSEAFEKNLIDSFCNTIGARLFNHLPQGDMEVWVIMCHSRHVHEGKDGDQKTYMGIIYRTLVKGWFESGEDTLTLSFNGKNWTDTDDQQLIANAIARVNTAWENAGLATITYDPTTCILTFSLFL